MKSSVLNGECEWRCYEHSQCFIWNLRVGGMSYLACTYSCSGGARQIN